MHPPVDGSVSRQAGFTLTAEDLVAGYRRQNLDRLWSLQSLVSGILSLAIVAALEFIAIPEASWPWRIGILGCGLLGGLLFPLAMIQWRIPRVARRIYAQQRNLQGETIIAWSAEGLHSASVYGEGRMPWPNYIRWREDDRIILLYQSDAIFQMLPKRALTLVQADDIRGLATAARIAGTGRLPKKRRP